MPHCLLAGFLTLIALVAVVVNWQRPNRPAQADDARRGEVRPASTLQAARSTSNYPAGAWVIEALGRDYSWHFRYPGADGELDTADDVLTTREAHVPLGAKVVFLVRSRDNVYSFVAPALKLRKIAVPELTYTLEFHPATAGSFDLPHDPLCGVRVFHNASMGELIIEPADQVRDWLLQQGTIGRVPRIARRERGD